jgi:hypothetical protein
MAKESVQPLDHGQGQPLQPLDHGQGQPFQPLDHGQGQPVQPLDHGQGQPLQPLDHGQGQPFQPRHHKCISFSKGLWSCFSAKIKVSLVFLMYIYATFSITLPI